MKIYLLIILVLVCAVFGFGQKKTPKKNGNLEAVVNQYDISVVKSLRNTGGMKNYAVKNKNIFFSDVDNDGDFDAIVEIFFCEKTSCHPTTQSSKLAIFINNKQTYAIVADKSFSLFGKINSVNKNRIVMDVYDLEEDDPQCCPELKRSEIYEYKSGKLIRSKK